MQDIIIVCADTYGLQVYSIISEINARAKDGEPYRVLGFISDRPNVFGELRVELPVLGTVWDCEPSGEVLYAMGIRDPKEKEKAAELIKSRGGQFVTIKAPWVLAPAKSEIGEGSIITNYCFKAGAKFGKFVICDAVMSGAVEVGDYSTVEAFANITNAYIGKRVYIGPHAIVLEHKKVGDDAYLCAGSVAFSNVKANTKVSGIPAKKVRE